MDRTSKDQPIVRLRLLGKPQVQVGSQTISSFRTSRIPALLGLLASGPESWSRANAASQLWPNQLSPEARHNLRQVLLYVRKLCGPNAIVADRETLRLGPDVSSDVQALLECGEPSNLPRVAETIRDVEYGEFLKGLADDWIAPVRAQCDEAFARLMVRFSVAALESNPSRSLEFASRAIRVDSFLDSARAAKIRALRALGEDAAGRREYDAYERHLFEELGIQPSEIVFAALSGNPKGPASSPASKPDDDVVALLSGSRPREGLDLAAARVPYWLQRGLLDEGLSTLRRAVDANLSRVETPSLGLARVGIARLLAARGRIAEGTEVLEDLKGALTFKKVRRECAICRARMALSQFRGDEARRHAGEALELSNAGESESRIDALLAAGEGASQCEALEECIRLLEECMGLAQKIGDWDALAHAASVAAFAQLRNGQPQDALRLSQSALDRLRPHRGRRAAFFKVTIARLLEEIGDRTDAEKGYRAGIVEAKEHADDFGLAVALTYLGDLLSAKGEFAESLARHEEALAIRVRIGEKLGRATSLRGIGHALIGMRRFAEAAETLSKSSRVFVECDSATGNASALYYLALATEGLGNRPRALRIARHASKLLRGMSRLARLTIGPEGDRMARDAEMLTQRLEMP